MAKSKEKKVKKQKKTPRDPYNANKKRGIMTDAELAGEKAKAEAEEVIKKFGPCHFDATQCRTAILMLQSDEPQIVIGSLNCLQKYCKKSPENCELFIELGGIPIISKLINSDNQVIQRLSLKVMCLVSKFHKAKVAIRDMDLVIDFLSLAQSLDEVVQEYASLLMSNLATLYTGRLQLIHTVALPILLKLLDHPDPDIIRNAIETIWRIVEEPLNVQYLLSDDVLKPIMKLIDSDYPTIQVIAMSILSNVAQQTPGTDILDRFELIENLGAKLGKMELGDLHRTALKTLINMAQSRTCCGKIGSILGHLMDVIDKTSDEKALKHAVKLAGKIACTGTNAKRLLDGGFGDKLIELLACDNMKLVATAAMAAAQISACEPRASKILTKAMESLLDYVENSDVTREGFENVMTAISHILESGKQAGQIFLEWGGKDTLVKIMSHSDDYSDDVLISTMTCIHNISLHWALRHFLAEDGIIGAIIGIMNKTTNPQVLVACATAMTGLLCEHSALVSFLNFEGAKCLIKLITHPEYNVVSAAVPIIHSAGVYEDVALEMIENGVLEVLWKREDLIGLHGPFRTALERLLCSNLSAKFAIAGHLDPFEKLPDGFYDYGAVKSSDDFTSLKKSSKTGDDPENKESYNLKKILYLNLTAGVTKTLVVENVSYYTEKNQENIKLKPIFTTMITQNDTCQKILDEILDIVHTDEQVRNEKEVVKIIAKVVTDRFGGIVDKWRISYEAEELEMANLQTKYNSKCIPITMMAAGAHRPRAILFKACCDAVGIPCSLERGGYRKVWNVVLLRSKRRHKQCPCAKVFEAEKGQDCIEGNKETNVVFTEKLRRFVVDLIHRPGTLLPFHSYEANAYCFF